MFPDYSHEEKLGGTVAGIDEVGRGCWAGPVIAAAAVVNPDTLPDGIQDSKKISATRREQLYHQLKYCAIISIGMASVVEIDKLNILGATKLAMQRAYQTLPVRPDHLLIDGNQLPEIPCPMYPVIKGDSVSLSIAAASIVAKVTRDTIMQELAQTFPHYGWENNAGYGTKSHIQGLDTAGVSIHHRRSFRPIRQRLEALTVS